MISWSRTVLVVKTPEEGHGCKKDVEKLPEVQKVGLAIHLLFSLFLVNFDVEI